MWGGAVGTKVGVIGGDHVLLAVRVLTAAGLAVAGGGSPTGARVSADRYNLQLSIPRRQPLTPPPKANAPPSLRLSTRYSSTEGSE